MIENPSVAFIAFTAALCTQIHIIDFSLNPLLVVGFLLTFLLAVSIELLVAVVLNVIINALAVWDDKLLIFHFPKILELIEVKRAVLVQVSKFKAGMNGSILNILVVHLIAFREILEGQLSVLVFVHVYECIYVIFTDVCSQSHKLILAEFSILVFIGELEVSLDLIFLHIFFITSFFSPTIGKCFVIGKLTIVGGKIKELGPFFLSVTFFFTNEAFLDETFFPWL